MISTITNNLLSNSLSKKGLKSNAKMSTPLFGQAQTYTFDAGATKVLKTLESRQPSPFRSNWALTVLIELLQAPDVIHHLKSKGINGRDLLDSLNKVKKGIAQTNLTEFPAGERESYNSSLTFYAGMKGITAITPAVIWQWLQEDDPTNGSIKAQIQAAVEIDPNKFSPQALKELGNFKLVNTVGNNPPTVQSSGTPNPATTSTTTTPVVTPTQPTEPINLEVGGTPTKEEIEALEKSLDEIPKIVLGQEQAITEFLTNYMTVKLDYDVEAADNPHQPKIRSLFLGPSGVGKTFTAEMLAKITGRPKIYVPLSQYKDEQEAKKLTGSGLGFVGSDKAVSLAHQIIAAQQEAAKTGKRPILILDEIEKAHESIFDILMQVLDKGEIETGDNQKAFLDGIDVVMTSNLAQQEIFIAKKLLGLIEQTVRKQVRDGLNLEFATKQPEMSYASDLVTQIKQSMLPAGSEASAAESSTQALLEALPELKVIKQILQSVGKAIKEGKEAQLLDEDLLEFVDASLDKLTPPNIEGLQTPFKELITLVQVSLSQHKYPLFRGISIKDDLYDTVVHDWFDKHTDTVLRNLAQPEGYDESTKIPYQELREHVQKSFMEQIDRYLGNDPFNESAITDKTKNLVLTAHLRDVVNTTIDNYEDPNFKTKLLSFQDIINYVREFMFEQLKESNHINPEQALKDLVTEALKRHEKIRPEFIGRINNVVVFETLSKRNTGKIMEAYLNKYINLIDRTDKFNLTIDQSLLKYLLDNGYNPILGTRAIYNLTKLILNPKVVELRKKLIKEDKLATAKEVVAKWEDNRVKLDVVYEEPVAPSSTPSKVGRPKTAESDY